MCVCVCVSISQPLSAQQLFGLGCELFVDVRCEVIRQLLDLLMGREENTQKLIKTRRLFRAEQRV